MFSEKNLFLIDIVQIMSVRISHACYSYGSVLTNRHSQNTKEQCGVKQFLKTSDITKDTFLIHFLMFSYDFCAICRRSYISVRISHACYSYGSVYKLHAFTKLKGVKCFVPWKTLKNDSESVFHNVRSLKKIVSCHKTFHSFEFCESMQFVNTAVRIACVT